MNDKQKIKAKIGKLKSEYNKESDFRTVRGDTAREVLDKLLSFIDSLPEEPVSEGIENELERFAYSLPHSADGFWPKDIDCKSVEARTKYGVHHCWSYEQVMNIARHFAEWQRKKDQEIDKLTESTDLDEASWKYSDRDGITYGQRYAMQIDFKAGAKWRKQQMMKELWHKGTDNPGNKHPYPVINPDTQEMAFAYYDQRFGLWEFDRDYNPGRNMLWLDIEKILPNLQKGGDQ